MYTLSLVLELWSVALFFVLVQVFFMDDWVLIVMGEWTVSNVFLHVCVLQLLLEPTFMLYNNLLLLLLAGIRLLRHVLCTHYSLRLHIFLMHHFHSNLLIPNLLHSLHSNLLILNKPH